MRASHPKRYAGDSSSAMIVLHRDASDDEILDLVRKWVAALAADDYAAAYQMTAHDPYWQWTPNLMRNVIAGYGLPEPQPDGVMHHVTPLETAKGGPSPRFVVTKYEPPRNEPNGEILGDVCFDLPLDGEWSDLTARFEILFDAEGLKLVLNEITVF
jgi:hypothetical protein